jgi:hypothetical protein
MVKLALRSVPGIGYATLNYFLMLLGAPGVKPDCMIHRFLKEVTRRSLTNTHTEQALRTVADILGVHPHELDHAIWCYQSSGAQQARNHRSKPDHPVPAQHADPAAGPRRPDKVEMIFLWDAPSELDLLPGIDQEVKRWEARVSGVAQRRLPRLSAREWSSTRLW